MSSRSPRRFAIRYSVLFALLAAVLGMGRRRASVEVGDDDVAVRMGWAFSARIPRRSIVSAAPHPRVWYAIGVHAAGRGDWIVNGTSRNMVDVRVDPPAPARAIGFPVRLRRLRVSVDHPADLVAALVS
jgi:hypothetical protein